MTAQPRPGIDAEQAWWQAGYRHVAGIDEVGRGALAGPLVAAAVVLPVCSDAEDLGLQRLRDSKVLTAKARSEIVEIVRGSALAWAIGWCEAWEIDDLGLSAANRIAMERALAGLAVEANALLLDATTIDHGCPQVGLIDGDAHCLSIAAASVVAKVYRDTLMADLGGDLDIYRFRDHKGYGTRDHLEALERHGPGDHHRRSFAPVLNPSRTRR